MSAATNHFSPGRCRPHTIQTISAFALFVMLCGALLHQYIYSAAFDRFAQVRRSDDHRVNLFFAAVEAGQSRRAASLLTRGVEVNGRDFADQTPLMRAAQSGRADVCALLIDGGADVNASTWLGWNALMLAAVVGDEEIVRLLLSRGADANARTAAGRSVLMIACLQGKPRLASILIKAGADVNYRSSDGETISSSAVVSESAQTIALIESAIAQNRSAAAIAR